jgi:hypothetical protein
VIAVSSVISIAFLATSVFFAARHEVAIALWLLAGMGLFALVGLIHYAIYQGRIDP